MINFNFAVRISSLRLGLPLNLTNHTQGDRKIETAIRLTRAVYVYQNTCKRNARMRQDPRLGPYRVMMIKTADLSVPGGHFPSEVYA